MVSTGRSERTSPDEFVERLKVLVANNIGGSKQLLTRFSNFVREADQAVTTSRAAGRPDAQALLSRWLDFNLESYSVLSAQSLALLNGLLSAAQSTLIPKTAPAAPPRVELRLSGRHGEQATTSFVIENHFDRPLSVGFESAALIPSTGPALPASLVSFEPIASHGQGVVQAAITIATDFVVGQIYATTIRLLGFDAKELGLSLTVLPPAEAAAPAGPSPEPPKSGEGRRSRLTK